MKISLFNGGFNNKLPSHLIDEAQAVEYNNIDSNGFTLKPLLQDKEVNTGFKKFMFNFLGNWFSSNDKRWYAIFEPLAFRSGGKDFEYSLDGILWNNAYPGDTSKLLVSVVPDASKAIETGADSNLVLAFDSDLPTNDSFKLELNAVDDKYFDTIFANLGGRNTSWEQTNNANASLLPNVYSVVTDPTPTINTEYPNANADISYSALSGSKSIYFSSSTTGAYTVTKARDTMYNTIGLSNAMLLFANADKTSDQGRYSVDDINIQYLNAKVKITVIAEDTSSANTNIRYKQTLETNIRLIKKTAKFLNPNTGLYATDTLYTRFYPVFCAQNNCDRDYSGFKYYYEAQTRASGAIVFDDIKVSGIPSSFTFDAYMEILEIGPKNIVKAIYVDSLTAKTGNMTYATEIANWYNNLGTPVSLSLTVKQTDGTLKDTILSNSVTANDVYNAINGKTITFIYAMYYEKVDIPEDSGIKLNHPITLVSSVEGKDSTAISVFGHKTLSSDNLISSYDTFSYIDSIPGGLDAITTKDTVYYQVVIGNIYTGIKVASNVVSIPIYKIDSQTYGNYRTEATDDEQGKLYLVPLILSIKKPEVWTEANYIQIYRQGRNLTEFTCIADLSYNAVNFNEDGIFQFSDDQYDDGLVTPGGIISTNEIALLDNYAKYLTEYNGRLYSAKGTALMWSSANAGEWLTLNYIDFKEEITGIAKATNGLVVFTKYEVYMLIGTDPSQFQKQLISSNYGCIAHDSIAYNGGLIYWLSADGLCVMNGTAIKNITFATWKGTDLLPARAVALDGIYYCLLGNKIYVDEEGNELAELPALTDTYDIKSFPHTMSKTLELELHNADALVTELTIPAGFIVNSIQINADNDLILIGDQVSYTVPFKFYEYTDGVVKISNALEGIQEHIKCNKVLFFDTRYSQTGCIGFFDVQDCYDIVNVNNRLYYSSNGKLYELFKGTDYREMNWTSKQIITDAHTMIKNTKVIYVWAKGNVTLDIIITDRLGNEVQVTTVELSEGMNEVKTPQELRFGYAVQLKAKGTGELVEVEFITEGRQNGR